MNPVDEERCSVIARSPEGDERWLDFRGIVFGVGATQLPTDRFEDPEAMQYGKEVSVLNPGKGRGWGAINDYLRAEFLEFVGSIEGQNVLDIGGGRGYVAGEFFERNDRPRMYYQTDLSGDVLVAANELTETYPEFQAVRHALGTRFPFEDQMFDTVIAKSVFLLLPEPVLDATLEEINRVADAGAQIALSFVHPEWLWEVDLKEDYPEMPEEKRQEPCSEGMKLERYRDGRPIYRPLDWYQEKFAQHGLEIADFREIEMPSGERMEMFPRFAENEGKKFYFMCRFKSVC
jgi:SAM-dependent methyltransferase